MEGEMKELKEQKVAEEYLSSLADLNVNSKPLINMLTILAEENIEHASVIVKVVEQHIAKVHPDIKLPILYLIDSIVKNVKSTYIPLFSQCIVNIFCGVFEQVSEKIRERMYTLRQTWNEVFTAQKLYTLDVKVNCMDRNWPITAKVTKSPAIHVNPNFLKKNEMEATLRVKTRELLELEKRKLELELEATKKLLQEQEKQLSKQTESVKGTPELHAHIRHPQIGAIPGSMQPRGMNPSFHTYRNTGPRQPPPNVMAMNMQQTYPSSVPQQHLHQQKTKVHPVNPLLLNTIRQRDPRLARQQQQQQQAPAVTQEKPVPSPTTDIKSKFNATNPSVSIPPVSAQPPVVSQSNNSVGQGSGSYRSSKSYDSRSTKRRDTSDRSNHDRSSRDRSVHDRSSKSRSEEEHSDGGGGTRTKSSNASNRSKRGGSRTRSESKSPTRSRGASARSSNRSGSSSRDKERRGNSGKTNADRRKGGNSNSRNNDQKFSSACPKIDEEPEGTNEVAKKKLNSPTPSPPKYKDSKSKSNSTKASRNYAGRKHKSRTPSPNLAKDVDLRVTHPDKRARLVPNLSIKIQDSAEDEEKIIMPPPPPTLEPVIQKLEVDEREPQASTIKFELEPLTSNVSAKSLDQNLEAIHSVRDVDLRQFQRITSIPHQTTASTSTTTTSTPANVVQTINKLEKSSEILVFSNGSNSSGTNKGEVQNETKGEIKATSECEDLRSDETRKEGVIPNGVPISDKKRQSTDDPGEPAAKRTKSGKIDGLFGTEDVDLRTVIPTVIMHSNTGIMTPPPPPVISNEKENWAKVKGSSPATKISPNKSSLDDVRAKLAKTAKFNKLEKSHKELSQRFKIYELQDETTTQECNDNKIREMISQAQESLESRSINEEQYQYLVKTAMQINETNKLNAAKRLESLNSEEKNFEATIEKPPVDPERLAREAVHKKRIPKLSKEQQQQQQAVLNVEGSIEIRDSPILVDDNSQDNLDTIQSSKQQSGEKEKRVKVSKWSAPSQNVNSHAAGAIMSSQQLSQRQRFGANQSQVNRPQFNNRMLLPSPWQNPNSIFNGSTQSRPISAQPAVTAPAPPQPPTLIIPKPCNSIDNPQADVVRTITIDGRTKEIRFYGDVAIVFMDWDQPREIGFQPGTRTITIDNKETIILNFNDDYKEVTIDGDPHKMRFAFPSRELYIDEHWYEVYFGGPAMPIPINNKIHLLQAEGPPPQVHIGILRRDLVVGKINMIVDARNIIPIFLDADPQTFTLDGKQHVIEFADNLKTVIINNEPMHVEYGGLPKSMMLGGRKYFVRFGALPTGIIPGQHIIKGMRYLKMQPPAIDRVPTPPIASEVKPNPQSLEAESVISAPSISSNPIGSSSTSIPGITPIIPNVNIDELFQKLISTGILNTITNNSNSSDNKTLKEEESKPLKDVEPIRPIKLHVPETIKTRQAAIINTLFCGMQCSSCGVRFPPEQTIKYSQHLDWHFRQNRRERDSSRKAHSRKWYYEVSDWLQYEEIEDLEDREKNFFESQQVDLESIDESSNQRVSNSPIPSCPAEPGDVDRACDMCQEKFEQFYNEDLEEWHLRAAVRVEDKIYHPLCYEDYKASLNPPEPEPETETKTDEHLAEITIEDDNAVDVAIVKIENLEDTKSAPSGTTEDDDDDVIVVPTEEPSITEIDDDEEYVPINMSREEMGGVADDNVVAAVNETMESDVEIQEPNIPFTDLDTYVEKPSTMDEASQSSLLNVKIKEEPKDDEEDDGFEDVGIVLIPEEEISIQSSDENTATRTISSTVSSPTPSPTVAETTAETSQPPATITDATVATITLEAPEATNSMDGNLEPNDNPLSATTALVGVNKIKINMTKNIVTSNNSSSTTTITKSNSLNQNELKSTTTSGGSVSNISTIPVLCSGATTLSTMSSLPPVALGGSNGGNGSVFSGHSAFSTIPSLCNPASSAVNGSNSTAISSNNSNVIQVITSHTTTGPANMDTFPNSIPVIGANSKSGSSNTPALPTRESATPPLPSSASKSPKLTVVEEEEPTFTFKPELQNVQLKKVKKIECGLEASGLCSIM